MTHSEALRESKVTRGSNHTTGTVLGRVRGSEGREQASGFDVYLHERGKKPRQVDVDLPVKLPGTIQVEGKTYYWAGADLSRRTVTYSDMKPQAVTE